MFIALGIAVGIAIALAFFIVGIRDRGSVPTTGEDSSFNDGAPPASSAQTKPTPKTPTLPSDPEEIYLRQLARIFVERFGSYSNQNDNEHIADAFTLATRKMQGYIATKALDFNQTYEGATTVVVATSILKRAASAATVSVDAQRVVHESSGERTEYLSGTVEFLKVNGEWKVDGVYWQ